MTTQTFAEIVLDYADTDKTTRTLSENFEGFSQILKEQSGKKGIWCVYTFNRNNLKILKPPYLKKNSGVRIVVDYGDTGFSIFAIKYLRENEKVCEIVFACSYGAQVEYIEHNKMVKNLVTLSLFVFCMRVVLRQFPL